MFIDTMIRWIGGIMPTNTQIPVRRLFEPIFDRMSCVVVATAGLVINGAGTKVAKIGATDCYYYANGVLNKLAAAAVMPALVGTVVNGTFNLFGLYADSAGALTSAMGTAGTSLGKVVPPQIPFKKTLLGYILINPTGTGNFVGGTTNLDDATVAPGAVYLSALSGFDPACLTGL